MTNRQRVIFLLTGWLIVLMPFLFWWNTWFGRRLTDKQITEYLSDNKHPRHIQHALIQVGDRIEHHDAGVQQWYPELVRLAAYPVDEVRNTDAWVMGQDNAATAFHEALLKMLGDSSLTVRGNAALALVRFGDTSGRSQITALLQAAKITTQQSGTIMDSGVPGTAVHQGGLVAKLRTEGGIVELRSPIAGRIRSVRASKGKSVPAGAMVATVDPDTEQVWEALRGLYVVGQMDDLPAITSYERELPEIPDRVRQQAVLTERAVRERVKGQ
jgi:acetyl/propionyl-CoA carboxylase alpha subunit